MPPHPNLHPRSRYTSSLFGTTLLVCFLVVGMPHLLPCPAPRTAYSDSARRKGDTPSTGAGGEGEGGEECVEGRDLQREKKRVDSGDGSGRGRRRKSTQEGDAEMEDKGRRTEEGVGTIKGRAFLEEGTSDEEMQAMMAEREELRRRARECPVPRPAGGIASWLGFPGSRNSAEPGVTARRQEGA